MTSRIGIIVAVALSACGPAAPTPSPVGTSVPSASPSPTASPSPAAPDRSRITATGWGPLRIGMSRAEVSAAGYAVDPATSNAPEPQACAEFRPDGDDVLLMIEDGRLARLSVVDGQRIASEAGIRIGDPASAVRQAHGAALRESAHKYVDAPAAYLTYWQTGDPMVDGGRDARGLLYEIGADGRVIAIRAGGPAIEYVEGCL